ncbi:MAG: hypothetical protein R3C68_12210 [Myxococcota bacterium]
MRRMFMRFFGLVVFCASLSACKTASDPLLANAPTDPVAFRQFLLKTMPDVLHETTCTCCNKKLDQCYRETVAHAAGACPDSCTTCLFEGRVALALKKRGVSDAEVARRTEAIARGEEKPPGDIQVEIDPGSEAHGHPHPH